MGKIIAIANHKGGVAKTTTAINLGAAFVEMGRKVLLVDLDPQCNLTETMYSENVEDTVYSCMLERKPFAPVTLRKGFDLLPGDKAGLFAEMDFSSDALKDSSRTLLKEGLEPLRGRYDFILVDCPPSRGILTVNALAAADEVLIPTLAEILAVRGMKDMNELIVRVRESLNPGLRIAGLLLVMFGDRTTASRKTAVYIEGIAGFLNTKLFKTRVRKNVAVVESQMAGVDLFQENSAARAAQDYLALAREYLGE